MSTLLTRRRRLERLAALFHGAGAREQRERMSQVILHLCVRRRGGGECVVWFWKREVMLSHGSGLWERRRHDSEEAADWRMSFPSARYFGPPPRPARASAVNLTFCLLRRLAAPPSGSRRIFCAAELWGTLHASARQESSYQLIVAPLDGRTT